MSNARWRSILTATNDFLLQRYLADHIDVHVTRELIDGILEQHVSCSALFAVDVGHVLHNADDGHVECLVLEKSQSELERS